MKRPVLLLAAGFAALTGAAIAASIGAAHAQTPTPQHQPRVIGQTKKPMHVPSFIVINSQGAQLTNNKLVLTGVSPNAIVFADRPVRSAGHAMLSHLLEEWSSNAPDSYAKDPPNATVSALIKGRNAVADAVVVLRTPKLEGDTLTFDVHVLEGTLAGADGPATVFVDVIDMPVPHRTSRRSAWYSGAN
jgi:hypothetical protein